MFISGSWSVHCMHMNESWMMQIKSQIIIRTNTAAWRKSQMRTHYRHRWHDSEQAPADNERLRFKDWILREMTHPLLRLLSGESYEWWSGWKCFFVSPLPSSGHRGLHTRQGETLIFLTMHFHSQISHLYNKEIKAYRSRAASKFLT